ncbi:MAG: glycosyltransferase [Thermaurantimonas sp.]
MISIPEWWMLMACLAPAALFQWYLMAKFFLSKKTPEKNKSSSDVPVSLIICARNELENLKKNLPSWLGQNYPTYEVIVVNDRSWDDSRFFLEEMAAMHSNLRIVTVPENEKYWTGKKFALTLGIKAAAYDTLLLTDADCRPASDRWMSYMMEGYELSQTEIVLGYGGYVQSPGLLNLMIRFETLQTGWLYLSAAWAGWPFMGIGRNLSYKKNLFFGAKGFYRHMHIPSGDDDLFINQVATGRNTRVMLNPEAVTFSTPKKTWSEYIYQRRRHFNTSFYYKTVTKIYLFFFQFSRLVVGLVTIASILGLSAGNQFYAAPLGLGLLYYTSRWRTMVIFSKRAGERSLGRWYPIMSILVFIVQLRIWLQNILIGSPKGWKPN